MNRATLLLVVVLSGCAHHPDEWRSSDTVRQVAVSGLIALDYHYTRQIGDFPPSYHEKGFAKHFIGRRPTDRDAAIYFATSAVVAYLIARSLPHGWRDGWQYAGAASQLYWIRTTCQTEIC